MLFNLSTLVGELMESEFVSLPQDLPTNVKLQLALIERLEEVNRNLVRMIELNPRQVRPGETFEDWQRRQNRKNNPDEIDFVFSGGYRKTESEEANDA